MWQEPTRLRDLIAEAVYEKKFEELTDEQKLKVHEIATKLRKVKEVI